MRAIIYDTQRDWRRFVIRMGKCFRFLGPERAVQRSISHCGCEVAIDNRSTGS